MSYPKRRDVVVYNEANGFVLTSEGLAGRDCDCEPDSPEWRALVREGVFLPVSLTGDGSPVFRVLLDESPTPEEREEFVDHVAWTLLIPDGRLALIGGCEYLWGEPSEDYMAILDVPPGSYRVDLHTCFAGINGPGLHWGNYAVDDGQPGATYARPEPGPLRSEPVGAWFRRTRPGEEFPRWLVEHCFGDPRSDPGHEQFWKEHENIWKDDAAEEDFLDFLLQLTPLASAPSLPAELPLSDHGWIPIEVDRRLPETCPRGLKARPPR